MSERASVRCLQSFLRALWGADYELSFAPRGEAPRRAAFSGRRQRLPACEPGVVTSRELACAAHTALHAELSGAPLELGQLKPLQRALIGVLEDARVERVALRRFPGLRRLWAPFHVASEADGDSAPALLGRLARALFDESYSDPSSWVERARTAFAAAAPGSPTACRELGSVLGNELGQLRLPFDALATTTEPAYRDDHTGLWEAEPQPVQESSSATADARREGTPDGGEGSPSEPVASTTVTLRYPEWDYVIGRERRAHCAVRERPAQPTLGVTIPRQLLRRTRSALRRAHEVRVARGRCRDGAELDMSAVVGALVLRARGEGGDLRLYRGPRRLWRRSSTLLLLDLSASLSAPQLALLQAISVTLGASLPKCAELAIDGFSSHGKEDVRYQRFKPFEAPAGWLAPERSYAGSTRLGAALRHATTLLSQRFAAHKLLLVVSDGEPADIDVFDERYLVDDARQACRMARKRGVQPFALCLLPRLDHAQRGVFQAPGLAGAVAVRGLEELPRHLRRAYACSTLGSRR